MRGHLLPSRWMVVFIRSQGRCRRTLAKDDYLRRTAVHPPVPDTESVRCWKIRRGSHAKRGERGKQRQGAIRDDEVTPHPARAGW